MIKMLVSSFYNTLIDEEDAIPTSTMLEIDRMRQKGIKLVILTNRFEEEVLYYNHDYPFIDYIISLNGSKIRDVNKNKITYQPAFTTEELEEIEKEYPRKEIFFYLKDRVETTIPQEKVYKVEIKGIKAKKKSKYYTFIFKKDKDYFLEICKNSYVNALKTISKEEMIAILGNDSEKELIESIEKTYVVRNAPKEMKEKAKYTTKSNKCKGVETVIKKEIK